ncbi:MAG: glycoside hydrolase family 2 protein [Bacteroidetes bacterium]|nr:glycoside hydrolase family 2 protein [Bacteroidota bacterium]
MKLFKLILLCTFVHFAQGQMKQLLHSNWEFKMEGESQWREAKVPGTVHQDLMREGLIENIYFENNEQRYQWIEEKNWTYRCSFNLKDQSKQSLVFEGLDTYAEIFVDDSLLGSCTNMFRTWEFDLSNFSIGEHQLKVVFTSPYTFHQKEVKAYPRKLAAGSEAGDLKVSPFSRKAAYHFGWDWAPRLVTCGIYRKVYLRKNQPRIRELEVSVLAIRDSTVFAQFAYDIADHEPNLSIQFQGQEFPILKEKGALNRYPPLIKKIEKAKLWWPKGYGDAHLYYDTLRLLRNGQLLDEFPFCYGLRTVDLVNEADSIGTSFYFKINGVPIFAKGANYVPQDMLLPRVSKRKYRSLLLQAANANMNMLRVWGGGVYEKDIFYHLCDSLGIMVWQDFMFAGTMYPADQRSFLNNVAKEVEDNIRRLRKHTSIVIWCGNNEIEVAWKNWGWQKQFAYSKQDSMILWKGYKNLFDSLIPTQIAKFDDLQKRPYTPSSPLSNWGTAENFKHSSMHYWGVWHGGDDFEAFDVNVGRFMVEYGFQSFPAFKTMRRVMADSSLYLGSKAMQNRQKSYIGNAEIERQVEKYYSKPKDFESFIKASQEVQSKALERAIRAHRSQQGFCMGSLMWQLNDCWPGPSWSIIDYFGKEKKAYRTVRKGFRNDFWYIDNGILTIVLEKPRRLELTLRYQKQNVRTQAVTINRNFTKAGVYTIDLWKEEASKSFQENYKLAYVEALFFSE